MKSSAYSVEIRADSQSHAKQIVLRLVEKGLDKNQMKVRQFHESQILKKIYQMYRDPLNIADEDFDWFEETKNILASSQTMEGHLISN